MKLRHALYALPIAALLALPGCTSTGAPLVTPEQVVVDIGNMIPALQTTVQTLSTQTPPIISPPVAAQIQGLLTQAKTLDANLSANMTATASAPVIQQIETDLNGVVTALAGLPIPPPYSTYVQAAAVLLPVVEAFVTSVIPTPAPAPAPAVAAKAGAMTPDQARLVLEGAAAVHK
jgi:hypothetical protein